MYGVDNTGMERAQVNLGVQEGLRSDLRQLILVQDDDVDRGKIRFRERVCVRWNSRPEFCRKNLTHLHFMLGEQLRLERAQFIESVWLWMI